MQTIWVRYDLSESEGAAVNTPSYNTNIGGYNVPVYLPYADPYYLPDTPQEFIEPGRGAYFALSTLSYSAYHVDDTTYVVQNMTATATAISLTRPIEDTPPLITISRVDHNGPYLNDVVFSFYDHVWRQATVDDPTVSTPVPPATTPDPTTPDPTTPAPPVTAPSTSTSPLLPPGSDKAVATNLDNLTPEQNEFLENLYPDDPLYKALYGDGPAQSGGANPAPTNSANPPQPASDDPAQMADMKTDVSYRGDILTVTYDHDHNITVVYDNSNNHTIYVGGGNRFYDVINKYHDDGGVSGSVEVNLNDHELSIDFDGKTTAVINKLDGSNVVLVDGDKVQALSDLYVHNGGTITTASGSPLSVISHSVGNPSGAIFALYEGLLGHAPDTAGGQSWVAALNAGTSLHDVTAAILASPEAQAHINASDNEGFVEQLYETVLGRHADADSAHSWVAALDAGTASRADVADALVFSDEHIAQLQPTLSTGVTVTDPGLASAERLYEGLLHRNPDATGIVNISDALAHGGSLQDVAQGILTSAEYTSAHPQMSDGQYVEALYENLLGRTGDAASAQSWTAALANGTDRASVANAFLDSAEFQNQYANQSSASYVEALYEHVLGHTGDAATVQSLASQLDAHSLSRIDVANSFTTTAEFQSHYPGSGDAGFLESLYQDALGRAPDAAGEQSWLYALSHGTSRADVALQIVDSPEAQQHLAAQVGAGLHVA